MYDDDEGAGGGRVRQEQTVSAETGSGDYSEASGGTVLN